MFLDRKISYIGVVVLIEARMLDSLSKFPRRDEFETFSIREGMDVVVQIREHQANLHSA